MLYFKNKIKVNLFANFICIVSLFFLSLTSINLYSNTTQKKFNRVKFLKTVRSNALEIDRNRGDINTAYAAYREKWYESFSEFFADYNTSLSQNIQSIAGQTLDSFSTNHQFSTGFKWNYLPTGTRFSINYGIVENNNVSDSFLGGDPSSTSVFTSTLGFDWTQPLLRFGIVRGKGKQDRLFAKQQVKVAKQGFNLKAVNFLYIALIDFLNYQILDDLIQSTQRDVKNARVIETQNKEKAKIGTIDKTELYDSTIFRLNNEQTLSETKKNKEKLREKLLWYIGEITNKEKISFIDSEKFQIKQKKIDINETMKMILDNNQELKLLKEQIKSAKHAYYSAHALILPQLDLKTKLTFKGQSSSSIGDTFPNIFTGIPDFNIGLDFSVPLNTKALKVVEERAKVAYKNTILDLEKKENQFKVDISDQIKEIDYLQQKLKQQKELSDLHQLRINEYRKDYKIGRVNLDRYIRILVDKTSSYRNYLRTLLEYQIALANLDIVTGVFIKKYNINTVSIEKISHKDKVQKW